MKWFFPFVSFLATPLFSFQRAVPFLAASAVFLFFFAYLLFGRYAGLQGRELFVPCPFCVPLCG